MAAYAVRRALYGILVIVLVAIFVFFALRAVPGDVVRLQLADSPGVTEADIAKRTAELGLDRPLFTQLFSFLGNAFVGDFGRSFQDNQNVMSLIGERLPITLELGIMALLIGLLLGIPIGLISSLRPNGALDQGLRVFSVAGLSIPNFWLGLMLITYIALIVGWSPPVNYQGPTQDLGANFAQLILPAIALGAAVMASIARMFRSSLLEVMQSNYVRTVRARGASRSSVLLKHATRNSIVPVFTVLGLQVGAILGGTVILEKIFSIPGMGSMIYEAVQMRDYPVILGSVVVYGAVFVFVNILVDLMYGIIDPRVRFK